MFIYSFTLTKEKLAFLLAIILIVLLVCGVLISFLQEDSLLTNRGRVAFLQSYGLSPIKSPYSIQTLTLPISFDQFYEEYEVLQKKQGLSLMPYQGKKVKKYTYQIINDTAKPLFANLFLKGRKLIACDLTCPDFKEGWVKPLLPEKEADSKGEAL